MANDALVVGQTHSGNLDKATSEVLAAAASLGAGQVSLILLGCGAAGAAQSAIDQGADLVLTMDSDVSVEEAVAIVAHVATSRRPRYVLGARDFGGGAMPRLAYRLGTVLAQDCTKLELDNEGQLLATRPVYGGSAIATVRCLSDFAVASLRSGSYDPLLVKASRTGVVESLAVSWDPSLVRTRVVERKELAPEGMRLEDAPVIVSGGRGLGGPEPFRQLEDLAKLLKGSVGASRAACDAGWVPASYQVGLTGKSVTPDLYIAIGISGASQHLAGISGARDIVAINKDPGAAIFKEARFGVAGDWAKVVPAFVEQVRNLLTEST